MKIKKRAAVLAILGAFVLSLAVTVLPVSACAYGCTPGFWKNPVHFGYWTDYDPGQTVGSVFEDALTYFPELADDTLLEALNYGGGPGLQGAAQIYLRAAVATLLSSAYNQFLATTENPDPWGYTGWEPDKIVARVNLVLFWGNRATMLSEARLFDGYNNTGCPLGQPD